MGEEEKAKKELNKLLGEHKLLDGEINNMASNKNSFDQLMLQRLKRRKLQLKDRIIVLQEYLCDDIIA